MDSEHYRDGFELECRAIKRAREAIGLSNIVVMVPFVRTAGRGDGSSRHGRGTRCIRYGAGR